MKQVIVPLQTDNKRAVLSQQVVVVEENPGLPPGARGGVRLRQPDARLSEAGTAQVSFSVFAALTAARVSATTGECRVIT